MPVQDKNQDKKQDPKTGIEKLKEDPLQTFLIVSAIILIVLYAIENWRNTKIEEGNSIALKYTTRLENDCITHSTGLDGDIFVFDCADNVNLSNVEKRIRERLHLVTFYIKNSSTNLRCESTCSEIHNNDI